MTSDGGVLSLKVLVPGFLCATSVSSVSLWCGCTRNSSTTETQRLHREERDRDFLCKASLRDNAGVAAAYPAKRVAVFEELRRRLFGIAYRMIGTTADAEDIVQEAYLRWHQADTEEIRSAEAWLVSVVTRLSIDKLRKASVEREKYIGPWLPEPLIASTSPTPEEELETAANLSMAYMVLLERLTPVERVAFLLHDVFDCAYPLIANIL